MKFETLQDVHNYLNSEPNPEDVVTELDEAGNVAYRYLPYRVVLQYLNELTSRGSWEVGEWKFDTIRLKSFYASGSLSIDISVVNGDFVFSRKVIGAATYPYKSLYPNHHFEATIKSLAIGNAAQMLGRRFGLYLNEDVAPKSIPDDGEPTEDLKEKDKRLLVFIKAAKTLEELMEYADKVGDTVASKMLFEQKKAQFER